MVRIISNVPEYALDTIRQLIEKGQYSSMDSFVRTAVENQIALELPEGVEPVSEGAAAVEVVNPAASLEFPTGKKISVVTPSSFDVLNLPLVDEESDFWIWGQVNRILPIKFILRFLAIHLPSDGNMIELSRFKELIRPAGRSIAERMMEVDRKFERVRGEGLAAAFPGGTDAEKAHSRFENLFIGFLRGDGKVSGAAPQLRFCALSRDVDHDYIGITKEGVEFAALANPVLDQQEAKPLSKEEVDFYLAHISKHVPGELRAFKLILSAISTSTNIREGINDAIFSKYPNWSPAMINTQRTGAMSRMNELGLISKVKRGVSVRYSLSERGGQFLAS